MVKTTNFFRIAAVLCAAVSGTTAQQGNLQIIEYVRMVARGNGELVSSKLPDLKKKYSHDPSIYYLEGLTATDGIQAIKYFRIVTDSFPQNEWTDDALARTAEISRSIGLPELVNRSIDRLEKEYPESPYIKRNYISAIRLASNGSPSAPLPERVQTEYTVQVGAFSQRENAERLRQRLEKEGYKTDIYGNLLDGKNLLYLLWVGSFKSPDEARKQIQSLKIKLNIDGVLRPRSAWKKESQLPQARPVACLRHLSSLRGKWHR